jgi:hypothetical protein
MPPNALNILHVLDIPARELKKKNPKRADSLAGEAR